MTRDAAHAAARALLDAMAGTTEGEWDYVMHGPMPTVFSETGPVVCDIYRGYDLPPGRPELNARYIARACPARLGPVLRALMGED